MIVPAPSPETMARRLNAVDEGMGPVVFFQHGLGGDRQQVAASFPHDLGCRRITVECAGHGLSPPDPDGLYSIARFADALVATADSLGIQRFAIGGISMGAAIALNIACRFPARVRSLALVRPAWLFDSAPTNMQPFVEVAGHLRIKGAAAREVFRTSPLGRHLAEEAPDNLASLLGFFDHPSPHHLADLLQAIARDGPGVRAEDVAGIAVPALVVGHGHDIVHPRDYAVELARRIPRASFCDVTPKSVNPVAYQRELQAALGAFYRTHLEE